MNDDVAVVRAGLLDTSNAIVPTTMTEAAFEGLAALYRLQADLEAAKAAIRAALDELGVPDENYPAPVANAVEILRAGLWKGVDREAARVLGEEGR